MVAQGQTQAAKDHAHRWRIDDQGNATSSGRCECGAVKEFANGWDGLQTGWAGAKKPRVD